MTDLAKLLRYRARYGGTFVPGKGMAYGEWARLNALFGAPAVPALLYYRLRITANQGATYLAVAEIALWNQQGGTDLTVGGTATSSSQLNATYSADKAFDKSNTTLWVTAATNLPATIQYQLAAPIAPATWLTIVGSNNSATENPTAFVVEKSVNGTDWQQAGSFSGVSWSTLSESKGFALT